MSRPDKGDFRTTYGYTFRVTEDHLTPEQLHSLKFSYDKLADDALDVIDTISPPSSSKDRDAYALLRDHAAEDATLTKLWDEVNNVPEWVDWDQIARGQEAFYRYSAPALTGFAFQGLLAGTGSSRRPAETLIRTGGHSVKIARHRFFETFQQLLQVVRSLEDVKPRGEGHIATVRVRFLHASVRRRILKLVDSRPTYYNKEEFGVPVNDLDAIQALCTYSTNIVWRGLPSQGIHMRPQEQIDYIALIRWMGYVIGAPHDVLANTIKAKAIMESLMLDAIRPTDTSRILANNIIQALIEVPPIYASREWWEAGARWINGDELCDDMGLRRPGLYHRAIIQGQCWLFMAVCHLTRSIPYLDRRSIPFLRNLFWNYIVSGKEGLGGESKFNFKYLPSFDKKTEKEYPERKIPQYPGIELIGLVSFMIGCSVLAMGVLAGMKILVYLLAAGSPYIHTLMEQV